MTSVLSWMRLGLVVTVVVAAAGLETKRHSFAAQALSEGQGSRWEQNNLGHSVNQASSNNALDIAGGYTSLLRGASNTLAAEEFVAFENGAAALMAIDSSLGTLLEQREQQERVLQSDELPVDKALRLKMTSLQDWLSFLGAQCMAHLLDTWMKITLLLGMAALLTAVMMGSFDTQAKYLQVGGCSSSHEKHGSAAVLIGSSFPVDAGTNALSEVLANKVAPPIILKPAPAHFRLDRDQDIPIEEEAEADIPEYHLLADEEDLLTEYVEDEVQDYHPASIDDEAMSFCTEQDAECSACNAELVSESDPCGYTEHDAEGIRSIQAPAIAARVPFASTMEQVVSEAETADGFTFLATVPCACPMEPAIPEAVEAPAQEAISAVVETLAISTTVPLASTIQEAMPDVVEKLAMPAMMPLASTFEHATPDAMEALAVPSTAPLASTIEPALPDAVEAPGIPMVQATFKIEEVVPSALDDTAILSMVSATASPLSTEEHVPGATAAHIAQEVNTKISHGDLYRPASMIIARENSGTQTKTETSFANSQTQPAMKSLESKLSAQAANVVLLNHTENKDASFQESPCYW